MVKKPVKTSTSKKTRKPKAAKALIGHNSNADLGIEPEKRELFLSDLRKWSSLNESVKSATRKRAAWEKQCKTDGFLMEQVKLGAKLGTAEGETEFKNKIIGQLRVAQYVGAVIGQQLSLFAGPDRTPAVDMAYDEGIKDSMENKPAKPGYDPSTPQFKRYMEGFNADTERRVKEGIKPIEPKPRAEVLKAAREQNDQPGKLN